MRVRLSSIYSEEHFKSQLENHLYHAKVQSRNIPENDGLSTLQSTAISFPSHKTKENDDSLFSFLSTLNINYKKDFLITDPKLEKDWELKTLLCKYWSGIIRTNTRLFDWGQKTMRSSSFDWYDKDKEISFRKVINTVKENEVNGLIKDNLVSLSFINILFLSNSNENLSNSVMNTILNNQNTLLNNASSTTNKHFLSISSNQIIHENRSISIKLFEINQDWIEQKHEVYFKTYLSLCNVCILLINGNNYSSSLAKIKDYQSIKPTQNWMMVIDTDNNPDIFKYCINSRLIYYNWINYQTRWFRDIMIMKKNLLKTDDYNYINCTFEENPSSDGSIKDDDDDCYYYGDDYEDEDYADEDHDNWKSGWSYCVNCNIDIRSKGNSSGHVQNNKIFLNKRFSFDIK